MGKLVDSRREQKRRAKDKTLTEAERTRAAGLDGLLKLVVNTVYGVKASRYFDVSNTVMGNNITARARMGVWMLAKSLGLRQCITDGGIYTPGRVPRWVEKKPGLDVLSRPWEWKDVKGRRRYTSMGGLDWTCPEEWAARPVDDLAMAHVKDFWSPYGLTFPFEVEHKVKHTFRAAAYWSKADYCLDTLDNGRVYALRGKDRAKRSDKKLHPTFALLDNILDGVDSFPADLSYTRSGGLLKIGKWQVVRASNGYKGWKDLRPGDDHPPAVHAARYNNTHFPADDEGQYRRRRDRKKVHRGWPVSWFERYGPRGISGVHNGMKSDRLAG